MKQAPTITKDSIKASATRVEVEVKFLTHVFGGGVQQSKSSEPHNDDREERPFDPITPIRASAIRGQLRYWWRATTGARYASVEEMREGELTLWGGLPKKKKEDPVSSAVSVRVEHQGRVTPSGIKESELPKNLEYVSFPLRPQSNAKSKTKAHVWDYSGVTFKLIIEFVREQEELERLERELKLALSAWLTFGGYGARTSRGFGAVAIHEHLSKGVSDDPEKLFTMLPKGQLLDDVPAISSDQSRWRSSRSKKDSHKAWEHAVHRLKCFRQDPRTVGTRPKWMAGDYIRGIVNGHEEHQRMVFPRARFGLPIIYHFKGDKKYNGYELHLSKEHSRLPSQVILRPSAQNEPMALWMHGLEPPREVQLNYAQDADRSRAVLSDPISASAGYERQYDDFDVIEEFMNYF